MSKRRGHSSPQEAARGDIPERFVTVLGTQGEGNEATVWMLTNDREPFEPYTERCFREDGRWFGGDGCSGFGDDTPGEVRLEAARRGWRAGG